MQPEVGLMGSFIPTDRNPFSRHLLGLLTFAVMFWNLFVMTGRVMIPSIASKYPLRVAFSKGDIAQLWAFAAFFVVLYLTKPDMSEPRFKDNWVTENRLSFTIILMIGNTILYEFCRTRVFTFLPEENRPAQAANIVRVLIKLGSFAYWLFSGGMYTALAAHPLQLTDEMYIPTQIIVIALGSLYQWETLFRDLRPVNIVHHGISLLGFCAVLEWASVLQATRTLISIGIVYSVVEGLCCLGMMCYRFMPRGKLLKNIMLSEAIFVVGFYTSLQIYFIYCLVAYSETFSPGWLFSFAITVLFTYPAQMNMARVFYLNSLKAGKIAEKKDAVSSTAYVSQKVPQQKQDQQKPQQLVHFRDAMSLAQELSEKKTEIKQRKSFQKFSQNDVHLEDQLRRQLVA